MQYWVNSYDSLWIIWKVPEHHGTCENMQTESVNTVDQYLLCNVTIQVINAVSIMLFC